MMMTTTMMTWIGIRFDVLSMSFLNFCHDRAKFEMIWMRQTSPWELTNVVRCKTEYRFLLRHLMYRGRVNLMESTVVSGSLPVATNVLWMSSCVAQSELNLCEVALLWSVLL